MTNSFQTEQDLVDALKRGDNAAFRRVYIDHFGMIRFFITQNSGTDADASDVFQDALVVLFEKLNQADFVLSSSLKTFLYSVCRNLWMKKLRSQKKSVSLTDFEVHEDVPDPFEEAENQAQKDRLRKAVEQLGVGCRKLLLLFYYFKKNMQEIASELGYTNADNAKNQKYKCLQRLKTIYHTTGKSE